MNGPSLPGPFLTRALSQRGPPRPGPPPRQELLLPLAEGSSPPLGASLRRTPSSLRRSFHRALSLNLLLIGSPPHRGLLPHRSSRLVKVPLHRIAFRRDPFLARAPLHQGPLSVELHQAPSSTGPSLYQSALFTEPSFTGLSPLSERSPSLPRSPFARPPPLAKGPRSPEASLPTEPPPHSEPSLLEDLPLHRTAFPPSLSLAESPFAPLTSSHQTTPPSQKNPKREPRRALSRLDGALISSQMAYLSFRAACAAASRAMGTRKGEQET